MTKNSMPIKVRARALAILPTAIHILPPLPDGSAQHEFIPGWSDQRVAEETIRALALAPNDPSCTKRHIQYMRLELYGKARAPDDSGMLARLAAMEEITQTLRDELETAREFTRYFASRVNDLSKRLGDGPLVELPPKEG